MFCRFGKKVNIVKILLDDPLYIQYIPYICLAWRAVHLSSEQVAGVNILQNVTVGNASLDPTDI